MPKHNCERLYPDSEPSTKPCIAALSCLRSISSILLATRSILRLKFISIAFLVERLDIASTPQTFDSSIEPFIANFLLAVQVWLPTPQFVCFSSSCFQCFLGKFNSSLGGPDADAFSLARVVQFNGHTRIADLTPRGLNETLRGSIPAIFAARVMLVECPTRVPLCRN